MRSRYERELQHLDQAVIRGDMSLALSYDCQVL